MHQPYNRRVLRRTRVFGWHSFRQRGSRELKQAEMGVLSSFPDHSLHGFYRQRTALN